VPLPILQIEELELGREPPFGPYKGQSGLSWIISYHRKASLKIDGED
jgi:hypothetical protein